jgi:DNA-binding MarR family transcriptional regulator
MAVKKKKQFVTAHLSLAGRAARTALSQRLTTLDLYPGQDAVLLAIGDEDGISLRDLAERLAVRPPTITKTVARLGAQGLVEKRNSDSDARQSHAHLTEKGLAIVDAVRATQKAVERKALKGFSNKERKQLRKLLQRVTGNLDGTPSPAILPDDE